IKVFYLLFLNSVARNQVDQYTVCLWIYSLNTYLLGEYISPRWSLGRTLRWILTVTQHSRADAELETFALAGNHSIVKSVGLYEVMDDAVHAVVGSAYHQFVRGSVTQFHTRILPHVLLVPGKAKGLGVPAEFHRKARVAWMLKSSRLIRSKLRSLKLWR
ncbi:hypothetical protein M405DRAFT_738496, partial [Rhizopogon salebrosus TDB-379]